MFDKNTLIKDKKFRRHWQMTNCERFALQDLLRRLKPDVSVEVGTYQGGSLQVISHFSSKVISIDSDASVSDRLFGLFDNVQYCCGASQDLLPIVFQDMKNEGRDIEFVLIDGDHSTDGIRLDINELLRIKPVKRCVVIIHDSFNPDCRKGILKAEWVSSPYVQWVELDFIPGVYHEKPHDMAAARTMWGGFACVVLGPEKRKGALSVGASQQGLFDAVYAVSVYADKKRRLFFVRNFMRRIFPFNL
jgi:hypothetical protein